MARIVAFNGSPREDGHCSQLLGEMARGAKAKGVAVTTHSMNNPGIRGCQGCLHCRTAPECAVDDAFQPAYADIRNADGIVFVSPIYFADITSQAKICVDRLFPALDGQSFRPRWPGKRVALVFAQGDSNPLRFQSAIAKIKGFFTTFGWEVKDTLVFAGASTLGPAVPEDTLKRAFDIGQSLVT